MKRILSIILCLILISITFCSCSADSKNDTEQSKLSITTDFHYFDTDESIIRAYEKLCNGVIEAQQEVKFNIAMIKSINQLFYTSFPLYDLVESIDLLEDNSGVSIKYKNSIEEHLKLVSDFTLKIDEIMKQCKYGTVSDDEYLLNVYTYVTQNVKIDNLFVTSYSTIINGKGVPASISSMFEYLLLQGGVNASHLSNISTNQASFISVAQFKGEWYYFNPVAEIEDNSGKALKYFAMDAKGAGAQSNFVYTDQKEAEVFDNDEFVILKNSESYTVEGSKLTVKIKDSDDFVIQLQ